MPYVYALVQPVTLDRGMDPSVTGYNNPWTFHSSPFQQIENAVMWYFREFAFERRDLFGGARVYRALDSLTEILASDSVGSFMMLSGIKYYFLPNDPTGAAAVIRDWVSLL